MNYWIMSGVSLNYCYFFVFSPTVIHEDEITETMTEFVDMSDVKSEFSEYSTPSRKSSLYGKVDEQVTYDV